MKQLTQVAIGLGSNLGDRLALLKQAAHILQEDFLQEAVSASVYESKPWKGKEQPWYLNSVLLGLSEWKPPAVVNFLKTVERKMGRESTERYESRLIDLDLLLYGNLSWGEGGIWVPHPYLAERDFVLAPLNELLPNWVHPELKISVKDLWKRYQETQPVCATVIASTLLNNSTL